MRRCCLLSHTLIFPIIILVNEQNWVKMALGYKHTSYEFLDIVLLHSYGLQTMHVRRPGLTS